DDTFKHVGLAWKTDIEVVKIVQDYKGIVREIDQLVTAFRYPLNSRGQPSVTHHFVFNVLAFAMKLEAASRFLAGAVTGLEEEWDQQASAAYERQELSKQKRSV